METADSDALPAEESAVAVVSATLRVAVAEELRSRPLPVGHAVHQQVGERQATLGEHGGEAVLVDRGRKSIYADRMLPVGWQSVESDDIDLHFFDGKRGAEIASRSRVPCTYVHT